MMFLSFFDLKSADSRVKQYSKPIPAEKNYLRRKQKNQVDFRPILRPKWPILGKICHLVKKTKYQSKNHVFDFFGLKIGGFSS